MSRHNTQPQIKDSSDDIHVVPLYDIKDHDCSSGCWCNPRRDEEEPLVFIHTSGDGREDFETGKRKPS